MNTSRQSNFSRDGLRALDDALEMLAAPVKYVDSQLNKATLAANAQLITVDAIVNIPSDKYVEVAPFVFDRLIKHPNDILFEHEEPYKDYISKLDFDNFHVVFVKSDKRGDFKLHMHDVDERIHCLKGGYLGMTEFNGELKIEIFHAGDIQNIPANTPHVYKPFTDVSYSIVKLRKS